MTNLIPGPSSQITTITMHNRAPNGPSTLVDTYSITMHLTGQTLDDRFLLPLNSPLNYPYRTESSSQTGLFRSTLHHSLPAALADDTPPEPSTPPIAVPPRTYTLVPRLTRVVPTLVSANLSNVPRRTFEVLWSPGDFGFLISLGFGPRPQE